MTIEQFRCSHNGSRHLHLNLAHRNPATSCKARNFILVACVASLGSVGLSFGQDGWIQPAGGSWQNPANWNMDSLPGNYGAEFNLASGSAYTVSIGSTAGAYEVDIDNNLVNLNTSGTSLQLQGNVNIAASAGQTSGFTFNGTSVDGTDGSSIVSNLGGLIVGGAGQTFLTVNNASVLSTHDGSYSFGAGSTVNINNATISGHIAEMSVGGITSFNASSATLGGTSRSEIPRNFPQRLKSPGDRTFRHSQISILGKAH